MQMNSSRMQTALSFIIFSTLLSNMQHPFALIQIILRNADLFSSVIASVFLKAKSFLKKETGGVFGGEIEWVIWAIYILLTPSCILWLVHEQHGGLSGVYARVYPKTAPCREFRRLRTCGLLNRFPRCLKLIQRVLREKLCGSKWWFIKAPVIKVGSMTHRQWVCDL